LEQEWERRDQEVFPENIEPPGAVPIFLNPAHASVFFLVD
jgi:hypothetical protein